MPRTENQIASALRIAVGLVVVYLVIGGGFALLMPPWETPDAPSHYLYLRHVLLKRTLPLPEDKTTGFVYPATLYEWHHPPLYYIMQSGVMRLTGGTRALIGDPEFVLSPEFSFVTPSARYQVPPWPWWTAHPSYAAVLHLRLSNLLFFGLPIVLIVYWVGLRLFQNPLAGAVLTAVSVMLPQSFFVHVSVQNDIAAILWSTAVWSIVIVTASGSVALRWHHLMAVGALATLGMVSKVNAFPTVVVAIVWAVVYGRKLGVVKALLLFGTPCLFALVVYLWFGFDHAAAFLDTVLHDSIMPLPTTPMGLWTFTRILFASFWGRLGWMNVPLAPALIIVFSVLSGINWLRGLIKFTFKTLPFDQGPQRHTFAWLMFGVVLQLLFVYIVSMPVQQPQGRFLFPAILPLWLSVSWVALSQEKFIRGWAGRLAMVSVLAFNLLTWYRLYAVYWAR